MAQPDDKGKLEIAVRILGNELVAMKMEVDDFKMKWLVYGVINRSTSLGRRHLWSSIR